VRSASRERCSRAGAPARVRAATNSLARLIVARAYIRQNFRFFAIGLRLTGVWSPPGYTELGIAVGQGLRRVQQSRCALRNYRVASSATPQVSPWFRRSGYASGVDHCEVSVRYDDGSRGALCIWADWRGIFSLTMPAGVIEITSLWFRQEGSAIAWRYRGSGLYPEASLSFRESERERASIQRI
jgi:hypothetical protein